MKRYILLLTFSLCIMMVSYTHAQDATPTPAAQATFNKKHPAATNVKWSKTKKGNYRAAYVNANKNKAKAIITPAGVELVVKIRLKKTPIPIQKYVTDNYSGYTIKVTKRINRTGKPAFFRVRIENGSGKKVLKFAANHKFVKELGAKEMAAEQEAEESEDAKDGAKEQEVEAPSGM